MHTTHETCWRRKIDGNVVGRTFCQLVSANTSDQYGIWKRFLCFFSGVPGPSGNKVQFVVLEQHPYKLHVL